MVCRSVPSASLFLHFYELCILLETLGRGLGRREKVEIQRRPENSDRVRLDARTRGIQTPDLEATSRVVASRFPTALSAVEKKKKKKGQ